MIEIQRGHYCFVFDDDQCKKATGAAYLGILDSENFHLFTRRFNDKYKGIYTVKFLFIDIFHGKQHQWNSNWVASTVLSWGYRSWMPRMENMKLLSKDKEIELKLLLHDSLSISAGRTKPLKLAIAIANEIRIASGSRLENVTDVFQEHQDKAHDKWMSMLSELNTAAVPPVQSTVSPPSLECIRDCTRCSPIAKALCPHETPPSFATPQEDVSSTPPLLSAPPTLIPRIKKTKKSADRTTYKDYPDGEDVVPIPDKATFKKCLEEPIVNAPDGMVIEGINTTVREANKKDMSEAVAEGVQKGLLMADALSQKSRETKIRTMQEEMLLKQGLSPVEVARIHNPNAGDTEIREISKRISNTHKPEIKKRSKTAQS